MLTHIRIRNFAIIDEVELELDRGLTVLTGETGAGKSILVDALGLALGDRADAAAVRHGEKRAEIALTVDISGQPGIRDWLVEQMIDDDDECLIRRVVGAEGRSRAFINGQPVPLASLRTLGERLVDIHGQHAHQSLLRGEEQRRLLDHHGGLEPLAARTAEAWQRLQADRRTLEEARDAREERDARLALLRYQVDELESLGLEAGELEALEVEHRRLAHAEKLAAGVQAALAALYEEEYAAQPVIARQLRQLEALAELDPSLVEVRDLLRDAEIQLGEAADGLRRYADDAEIDPERVQWAERRLGRIRELSRKHRVEEQALHTVLPELREELDGLESLEATLGTLEQALSQSEKAWRALAGELSDGRRKAATSLGQEVTALMQELGMAGGRFEVSVDPLPADKARASGLDIVEFRVSANPGQPPRALARVASGGELSRIALAIQVIAADAGSTPCMVFDEVDAGIGGGVAEIVGRKLRELGERRQVLCVTHVPQVASQGHSHLHVSKHSDSQTHTTLQRLDDGGRIEELARMLGGVEITARTRAHAEEMLGRADQPAALRRT